MLFKQNNGGAQDAVVLKFNPTVSALSFASYLGGSGDDAAYVLSLAPNGDIYVAGGTSSTNFPGTTAGVIHSTNQGGIDGFVSIITNNGNALLDQPILVLQLLTRFMVFSLINLVSICMRANKRKLASNKCSV